MKILLCTDASPQAENAIRFGARIAAACQAETTLLGIGEDADHGGVVIEALQHAQEFLKEYHLNAELISKLGRPVREIVKRTRETHYDLVVIGAVRKNASGPLWMSARAYKIVESVEPPVLVVVGNRTELRRILLCTGGTSQADEAVKFAGNMARRLNVTVHLFHVVPELPVIYADLHGRGRRDLNLLLASNSKLGRNLRHQKEMLVEQGVPCEFRLRSGSVVAELMKELSETEYDLVISGSSPARDVLRKYVMGDITREIVNRVDIPVLVVRTLR